MPPVINPSKAETGNNNPANQKKASEVVTSPVQNTPNISENTQKPALLDSIQGFDKSKLNKASDSTTQKSVVTAPDNKPSAPQGMNALLQQIREKPDLKRVSVEQDKQTSIKSQDNKAQQAKSLTPMDLMRQEMSKRRKAMNPKESKENLAPEQLSPVHQTAQAEFQANPIKPETEVSVQPEATIPPPPPLPSQVEASQAQVNSPSDQQKASVVTALPVQNTPKPNNTDLLNSIQKFNKDNLKQASNSAAPNNNAQQQQGTQELLQQIREKRKLKSVDLAETKKPQRTQESSFEGVLKKAMEKREQSGNIIDAGDQDSAYQSGEDDGDW